MGGEAEMGVNAETATNPIRFVKRLEPSRDELEDADTGRLVTRVQAGDAEGFAEIYRRYFDRVYTYLRLLLNDRYAAEDAAQQVFLKAFQALPSYEHRRSFWVWLFTVMRNHALTEIEKRRRVDVEDPAQIDRRREATECPEPTGESMTALGWIADRDLVVLIERLPLRQRQVIGLRYMLDLSNAQVAALLDTTPADATLLHHRALAFLRERLTALGRDPRTTIRSRAKRPVKEAGVIRSRRFALLP